MPLSDASATGSPRRARRSAWTAGVCAFAVATAFSMIHRVAPALGPPPERGRMAVGAGRSGDGGTPVGAGHEPVGCTSRPGAVVTRGGGAGGDVALTFDDGPSLTQAPRILGTLERLHARATFFEEGRHVHGREALMRQLLADGDEIGNHSYHHVEYPGERELAATDRRIRAATGFEPCLFRPPYGLIDGRVTAAARRNGLEQVLWSVDSGDDHHPGVGAIRATAVGESGPGSIVLMHDGGHHPQTVRAVAPVVRGLRRDGLHLVTVTKLLGGKMRYGP